MLGDISIGTLTSEWIRFLPDGSAAFFSDACGCCGNVQEVSPAGNGGGSVWNQSNQNSGPLAFSATGSAVFTSNMGNSCGSQQVVKYDAVTHATLASFATPGSYGILGLAATPDGTSVFVSEANSNPATIQVLDSTSLAASQTITIAGQTAPTDIAFACTGGDALCGSTCISEQSDPLNCGRCGHSCQGGACSGGACQPVTLASGQARPTSIALDAANVYWVNYSNSGGTLAKAPLGGGAVATLASGQINLSGLAVDAANVYWTNLTSSGGVWKEPLGGGAATTLVSGQNGPSLLTVESTNVYWTNAGAGTVMQVPIGGGGATTLATGQNGAAGIAVDSTSAYWANYVSPGAVMKAPLAGGAATTLASGQDNPIDIAIDSANIYWVNVSTSGQVMQAPIGGGNATTLATGQNNPVWVAVDSARVYWTTESGGTVMKLAKP